MNSQITYNRQFDKRMTILTVLAKYDHTALSIPQASEDIRPLFSKFSKDKPAKFFTSGKILGIQLHSLKKLYASNYQEKIIANTSAWDTILNQMQWFNKECEIVNPFEDQKILSVSSRLKKVFDCIDTNEKIAVSFSHGDITPWNLNGDDKRLYRYNWETSDCGIPMLTDLFHFLFLPKTLSTNHDFKTIKKSIDHAIGHSICKSIIEKYRINVDLHYRIYLLFSITHYLRIYNSQKFSQMQLHRLMDIWNEALLELE
ncbi:MAG: hypothetical protein ACHQNT_04750 [Bacteroidia bacterium]